jgi:hypothetical protein
MGLDHRDGRNVTNVYCRLQKLERRDQLSTVDESVVL